MPFRLQTSVDAGKSKYGISFDDGIMVLGSCFADNIGSRLKAYGFNATVNPFGTLYNPCSVADSVFRLESGTPFTEDDIVEIGAGDGRICSFHHHSSFARGDKEDFLRNANDCLARDSEAWKNCRTVLVTYGTAWVFRHDGRMLTVANCLKRPAAEFTRYRLSVSEVTEISASLVEAFPDKRFIFTVSPIRHLADGAHGNQLSKATLLLGLDAVNGAEYFPAYEIMMDELRDYRFWADDLVHPSQLAVEILWERFIEWALPEKEKSRLEAARKAYLAAGHVKKDGNRGIPGQR